MLNPTELNNALRAMLDKDYSGFEGLPSNTQEAAQKWADVLEIYFSAIVPPSTTVSQAAEAFGLAMQTISVGLANAIPVMIQAFATCTLTLGSGMIGFIPVPPPLPIDFTIISAAGLAGVSGETIASMLTTNIDIYFKTGTATPAAGGSPILWS